MFHSASPLSRPLHVWLWLFALLLMIQSVSAQTLNVPPRSPDAMTGSRFVEVVTSMSRADREKWIFAQVISGNVPDWQRALVPITATANITGTNHTVTYHVIPDYVAIGSDTDYFLCPMTPNLAQRLCDALNCTLPTRRMVNQIWTNAAVKLEPKFITASPQMTTVPVFDDHNTMVRTQRNAFTNSHPLGALVSGNKKDVVISPRIYGNFANTNITKPVVIYGWHYQSGSPIQPLYNGHEDTYADYSHGIRLVQMACTLNGQPNTITNICANASLSSLLSDEGTILTNRYPIAAMGPLIVSPPRSRAVVPGTSVKFRALVAGDAPLSYQWKRNGGNLNGATNATLQLTNVSTTDAGQYTVTVANSVSNATSRAAVLTAENVSYPPLLIDSFDADSSANWDIFDGAVNAVSDYTVAWAFDYGTTLYKFNGVSTLIPPAPHSTDGVTRAIRFTVNNNDANGSPAGVNIYPKAFSASGNFRMTFDLWINYPGNAGGAGSTGSTEHAIFGLNHAGTRANWAAPSAPATDGLWFGVDGEGGVTTDYRAYLGNPAGTQFDLTASGGGLVATDSAAAVFQNLFPAARFESAGTPGKNWVRAELSQSNNIITWKLDDTVVAQRTNTSSFTSGKIMLGFMDTFSSIASPAAEAFVLFDNLRVEDLSGGGAQMPSISVQPTNLTVSAGSPATFSVTATGTPPLYYQWQRNGTNLPGATDSSFTISNAQPANAGEYRVAVSNLAGVVTSDAATLTVNTLPPQFSGIELLPDGKVQLEFTGNAGADYVVEATTNFANWKLIKVLAITNGPLPFVDAEAAALDRRFYRAFEATDQLLTDFEAFSSGTTVFFQPPSTSGSTAAFLDTTAGNPNFAYVTNSFPPGHASDRVLHAAWSFKSGTIDPWLRLTSNNTPNLPNPTVSTNQVFHFDLFADKALYVALGLRETNPNAPVGGDGGTNGPIEWVGGSSDNSTSPPRGRFVPAGQWATLSFIIPHEPVRAFTGNGALESTTGKAVFEHLCLVPAGGSGIYNLFLDNFRVVNLVP